MYFFENLTRKEAVDGIGTSIDADVGNKGCRRIGQGERAETAKAQEELRECPNVLEKPAEDILNLKHSPAPMPDNIRV